MFNKLYSILIKYFLHFTLTLTHTFNCLNSFEGIPYAKPPVGKLRFKRTEPLLEITNDGSPFHATSFGRRCFQPSGFYYPQYIGQEDCLTLNVFVPNTDQVSQKIVFSEY